MREVPFWVLLRARAKLAVWPWGLIGLAMATALFFRAVERGGLQLWIAVVTLPITLVVIWVWNRRRPKPERLFVVGLTSAARAALGQRGGKNWATDSIPQWPVWIDEGGLRITIDGDPVHIRDRHLSLELGVTKTGSVATCVLISPTAEMPAPVLGRLARGA